MLITRNHRIHLDISLLCVRDIPLALVRLSSTAQKEDCCISPQPVTTSIGIPRTFTRLFCVDLLVLYNSGIILSSDRPSPSCVPTESQIPLQSLIHRNKTSSLSHSIHIHTVHKHTQSQSKRDTATALCTHLLHLAQLTFFTTLRFTTKLHHTK